MESTTSHRFRWTAVGLALALGAGGAAWWVTHPDVFGDAGGYSLSTAREEVGTSYYAGLVSPPLDAERRELELRSATPVVAKNTADADLEVYLCEVDPGQGAVGVGSQRTAPTDVCSTFERVTDGTRLVVGGGEAYQELVIRVQAAQPGVVEVRGIELSYRDGLRRGTQVTGGHLTYRAR
ncbi:MAG: hypothetical protein ABF306_00510 [Nocardioides marinisabuli]|uniref:hypothetical protein n=1 Tax=Nocardioides marinisabuli TaxID=419476 RepID=UPI00321927B1